MCRMITDGRGGRWAALRDGIETTRMPRMASSQASHRQPAAAEQAEPVDRLERIVGTGRMESACGTEQRADGPLVYTNQECGNVPRCSHWLKTAYGPRGASAFSG